MDIEELKKSLDNMNTKIDKETMIKAMQEYANDLDPELVKHIKTSFKSKTGETHVIYDVTLDAGIPGLDYEIQDGDEIDFKELAKKMLNSMMSLIDED